MNPAMVWILIVDASGRFYSGLKRVLSEAGYRVRCATTATGALRFAEGERFNIVVDCFEAERGDGMALMDGFRRVTPDTQFILVSDGGSVRQAIEAIHQGAFDYIAWPSDNEQVLRSVRQALEHQALVASDPEIRTRLRRRSDHSLFAGQNESMREVQRQIEQVASTDVMVLIQGESGTGKEIAARALHEKSARTTGPFVAVNCGALSESLIESELFGHLRGAFTGANADKPGRFDLACGGSLFLDEIGDLSPKGQADLLRVLEDGVFRPIGSRTVSRMNARVIAATNKDLEALSAEGGFREDLFYRLSVITLRLPPLRERAEDIPELVNSFAAQFAVRHKRREKKFSTECLRVLMGLPWPGNVRQLRNMVERLALTAPEQTIKPEELPCGLLQTKTKPDSLNLYPGMTLLEAEKELIRKTLTHTQGNRTEAAKLLQISRRSLHYRIKQHQLA